MTLILLKSFLDGVDRSQTESFCFFSGSEAKTDKRFDDLGNKSRAWLRYQMGCMPLNVTP